MRTADVQNQKAGMGVGLIFTVIGIGMLVGGAYWGLRTKHFVENAKRTNGRVIEMVAKRDDDGTTWSPKVEFTPEGGQLTTFTSSSSSNPPSHREGDVVRVLYDPANPGKASIDSFMDLWFGPLLVGGVFGVIF